MCPSWPRGQFRTAAACRQIGVELNELGARLRGLGFGFHFHNHDAELAIVEGRRVFDWMLDAATPENLGCQADVYWVHVGGKDPAEFIREQGRRIRLLHVKDEKEIGTGPVDFGSVFAAAESIGSTEWYVIEVEQYNHDPIESVRLSFEQLRTWGKV
jgi:sugar phosphate isomerase/epimerase